MPFHSEPGILPMSISFVTTPAFAAAASECSLAVNPSSPNQVVAAVRQVSDRTKFAESIVATYYSADGGGSWRPSTSLSLAPDPLLPQWGGATNPSVAWDNAGNAFLLALPIDASFSAPVGIAFYKSVDGGATWGPPILCHASEQDDKPNLLVDTSSGAHKGRIYALWSNWDQSPVYPSLAFARSDNAGATWYGPGAGKAGDRIANISTLFPPTACISPEGTLYVSGYVVTNQGEYAIDIFRSDDGGETFANAGTIQPVNGIGLVPDEVKVGTETESGTHFDDATFRTLLYPAAYAGANGLLICAWSSSRDPDGVPRMYYARSSDYGKSWEGIGLPEGTGFQLSEYPWPGYRLFHPRLAMTPSGTIVCAYCAYLQSPLTPKDGVINVHAQASFDGGKSFCSPLMLNSNPCVTSVNPIIIGKTQDGTQITFYGDYFGLTAGSIGGPFGEGFISVWTDTSTGSEQIVASKTFFGPILVYEPDVVIPRGVLRPADSLSTLARFILSEGRGN